jgi:rubrerythrin
MGLRLNADEALDIAQKIEQNGANFYKRAAGMRKEEGERNFFLRLADMEYEHERIFRAMQDELSDEDRSRKALDPFGEMLMYLEALADTSGGEGSPLATDALTGDETLEQIIQTALELEKESILFYVGLKDIVPDNRTRQKIDEIIGEEKSHLVTLKKELDRVRK